MAHTCHAVDCETVVKPEYLMCYPRWKCVPLHLQKAVWRHYRDGQCDDKSPSVEWMKAANAAIRHIAEREGITPAQYQLFPEP
jgi:hypothetical protein